MQRISTKVKYIKYIHVAPFFQFVMSNTLYLSFQCLTEATMGPFQLLVLMTIPITAAKVHA